MLFAHSAMSILKGTVGAELTISVSTKTDVSNLLLHQHDQNKSIEYLDGHHHELKHPLETFSLMLLKPYNRLHLLLQKQTKKRKKRYHVRTMSYIHHYVI